MKRSSILPLWCPRLDREQGGFTIVEVVAAMGIMFLLLVSLAYVVTSGMTYQREARLRQSGNAVANQIMEQVRGLPYEAIQSGMLSTDLTGDPNVVPCDAGTTTKLFACTATAGSPAGTAERIVSSPSLATTTPLVPHRSSTAPNAHVILDGVTYTWATYVSQGTESSDGDAVPYRVTVEVGWTGAGGAQTLRIQSLFWSPTGCRSVETHPFAAPCQAFFYGKASVPAGTIEIVPTTSSLGLVNTEFDEGELSLGGAQASLQQEQVVQSLSSFSVGHVEVTTSGVATTHGAVQASAVGDSDPNTSATGYQRLRCGTEVTCAGTTVSSPSAASPDRITFTLPTTTTAEAVASFQAESSEPCPPSNVTSAQDDLLACAGASYVQSSDITAVATVGSTSPALGSFDVARISAPAAAATAPIRAFGHRVTNPTSDGCTPDIETDGCTTLTAARSFGTIAVGGLPSGFGTPLGWQSAFVRITGYSDSATASVGDGSPFPTTSASAPSGQIEVYNGTGYDAYALTSNLEALSITRSLSTTVSGSTVTATFTLDEAQAANSSVNTTSIPTSGGASERTDATAQVAAPVITIRYRLAIGPSTVFDLTTTVDLGTLDLDGSYAQQPEEGT
jgi:type II secretory pathway pseudopilin PulG